MVVLPTDEIYKERVAAQKAAKEMDIPDEAIMEMKGIILDLILTSRIHFWMNKNIFNIMILSHLKNY